VFLPSPDRARIVENLKILEFIIEFVVGDLFEPQETPRSAGSPFADHFVGWTNDRLQLLPESRSLGAIPKSLDLLMIAIVSPVSNQQSVNVARLTSKRVLRKGSAKAFSPFCLASIFGIPAITICRKTMFKPRNKGN